MIIKSSQGKRIVYGICVSACPLDTIWIHKITKIRIRL